MDPLQEWKPTIKTYKKTPKKRKQQKLNNTQNPQKRTISQSKNTQRKNGIISEEKYTKTYSYSTVKYRNTAPLTR